MTQGKGYWLPHTSSVDFCEPDYFLTNYIAEPHNVWSSLFICYLGIIGMVYGNPTKEWGVWAMFAILCSVGLGSAALHTTLHWLPQSSDEVPMLWVILSYLHMIWKWPDKNGKVTQSSWPGVSFFALGVVQTVAYYAFQQIYAVFLASMTLYSTIVIVIFSYKVHTTKNPKWMELRWKVHVWACSCYLLFGVVIWVIDMNLCNQLLPYYKLIGGFTLHVVWHIFAGLGAYFTMLNINIMRSQEMGYDVYLKYVGGIPVCAFKKP